MEKSNNHLNLDINYWEAIFSSFAKINKLNSYFTEKLKPTNDESLTNLLYNFLIKDISINNFVNEFQNMVISKNINSSNPAKLINFFLEELHYELENRNKNIKINEINNKDSLNEFIYDNDEAYKLFTDYAKNNKSFIQELFFGIKNIKKSCQTCKSTSYEYSYLKFIPLNLQNITDSIKLEYLFNNVQREYAQKLFCPKCKKEKEFKKQIVIKKMPEVLILLLYNYKKNIKVDFVPTLE
jgi:ubiquitin C-terminal hydrolase